MNDLEAIEAWGEYVLTQYANGKTAASMLCEYTDRLPSRSIRSQMLLLVAALRAERARNSELAAENERALDLIPSEFVLRLAEAEERNSQLREALRDLIVACDKGEIRSGWRCVVPTAVVDRARRALLVSEPEED